MKKVTTLAAALALGLSMTSGAFAGDAVKPLNQVSTIASLAIAPAALLAIAGAVVIVGVGISQGNNSNGT